jgi:hypothetical protein
MDLLIDCRLKQLIQLDGLLSGHAHIGDFDGERDLAGVRGEIGKAQLLLIRDGQDNCHCDVSFLDIAQKSRSGFERRHRAWLWFSRLWLDTGAATPLFSIPLILEATGATAHL